MSKKTVKIIEADNKESSHSINSTAQPIKMSFKNNDINEVENLEIDSNEENTTLPIQD